jgi:hypothetical protein
VALGQVVGDGDRVAGVEEVPGDDAADVAGAADDERPQDAFPRRGAWVGFIDRSVPASIDFREQSATG